MSSYSELCHKIKQRMCWDKILISPVPRSKVLHEGYRIGVTTESEDDIEQAKKFLRQMHIICEDRVATSFSDTLEPGDRTLRVTHQKSVINLRKMWTDEFEKSRFAQTLKNQSTRR